MRVVVFSKKFKEKDTAYVQQLFDALREADIAAYVFTDYLEQLQGNINFSAPVGKFDDHRDFSIRPIDFVITLGGDGTILEAVTLIREKEVPILGINLGRLGFLAATEKRLIRQAVQQLVRGQYEINSRSMICLESNLPLFKELDFALNDFTLLKRDTSSMITIHTYINGSYLNSYWADGLIVATPTGSTGYSLSCGGPIVFPGSGNFVITPVAPHNLNVRPIVISDSSVLSFEIEGRSDNFLCTLDSRFEMIGAAHQLAVKRNGYCTHLVQLRDVDFQTTIRSKLGWGLDKRN